MCRRFESGLRYSFGPQGTYDRTTRTRTDRCGPGPQGPDQNKARSPAVAKQTDVRPKITLACVECKERNYITRKNRRNDPDRLELKKFCPRDRRHTLHRETR